MTNITLRKLMTSEVNERLIQKIIEGIESLLKDDKNKSLRGYGQLGSLKEKLKEFQKIKSHIDLNHALQIYKTSHALLARAEITSYNNIWDKTIKIADELLTLENLLNKLDTECQEYDKKINQLVYKLYGLTTEEIEIVENGS